MTRMAFVFFAFTLALAGCTPTVAMRGNMIKDEQIAAVELGFNTRSDVLRKMGSPTTKAPFDENIWYYIGQETQKKGILDEKVMEERIIQVTFNDKGVVQTIQDVTSEREDIPFSRDKTKTHGNDYTFMQQLLGNLGRFNTPQGAAGAE